MTTLHIVDKTAIRDGFGVPENASIGAAIPVRHPAGRYGPPNRRSVLGEKRARFR